MDIDFLLSMKKEDVELLFYALGEFDQNFTYPLLSRKYKRRIDKSFFVIDLKNVKVMKTYFKIKNLLDISNKIYSDYFPETMYKFVVLNAG